MHVRDALAKLGPGLPAVLDQLDVGKAVQHGARRAEDGIAAAFGASGGEPQLEIGFVAVRDFERRARRAHKVFQRPRGAESADAQRAAGVERTPRKKVGFEVIQVRQVGARPRVGAAHPFAKLDAVSGQVEIVGGHFHLHGFANQPDAVGIGLKKADVGVAIDGEAGGGVRQYQGLNVHRRHPGRGDDDVGGRIALQSIAQVFGADHRPDVGDDAAAAKHLAGVQGRDAESDVADVLLGGEILIGEDQSLHLNVLMPRS